MGTDPAHAAARSATTLVLLAAGVAAVGGAAVAVAGTAGYDATADSGVGSPMDPASSLTALLPVLPVLLVSLASLLGLVLLGLGLLARPVSRPWVARGSLLLVGPLLVLAGAGAVPDLVNPCRVTLVSGACVASGSDGVRYADHVDLLGHALFGWVPLALLLLFLVRHTWPDLVPRWAGRGRSWDRVRRTPA